MKYQAEIGENTYRIEVLDDHTLSFDGKKLSFDIQPGDNPAHYSLILDGKSHQVWVEPCDPCSDGTPRSARVQTGGFTFEIRVDDERSLKLRQFAAVDSSTQSVGQVMAPMPGLVVKLLVSEGDTVKKGDGIVIVEAMKMENEIRAPISGTIEEIRVTNRQAVEKGEILAVIN